MRTLTTFYDRYHLKNDKYVKVISAGNFTYFYILQFLQRACTEGFAQKRVLDVGCGVGTMSLYLASIGAKVTGIDISQRAIEICETARKALHLRNVTFHHQEIKAGSADYDVVVCFEVVEHIAQEKQFLKKIHSHLKQNGKLILSTPSKNNLLYKNGFYKKFDEEVGHLRRYTVESLEKALREAGFKVEDIREVEGPLRNILFTTKLGFIIRFIKGPLVPLFHFFDTLSGKLFGFSDIQVLASKV